jgi:hypothetical protein
MCKIKKTEKIAKLISYFDNSKSQNDSRTEHAGICTIYMKLF